MKVKFITLTCEKYHDNRVDSIRKTWGKGQDVSFLSDFNLGTDIVGYENLPRGYEFVSLKYIEYLKNQKEFDHDWYFFTDDDTFVHIENVTSLLERKNPDDMICIGHMGRLNMDGTDMDGNQTGFPLATIKGDGTSLPIDYVSGGAGFILSRNAMSSICEYMRKIENPANSYNGDVTFGFWMRQSGITVVDVNGFWWTNPIELKHNLNNAKESFTYHYIDPETMRHLHMHLCSAPKGTDIKNCIITQAKDQGNRLENWVLYHLEQGFDTFIYFDDFSEDDSIGIMESLRDRYGINIIIKYSDGVGNRMSREAMQNSESYGGDTSINYRIIRSFNSGLNIAKKVNPNSICAFIDVDEFLVSNTDDKAADIIAEHMSKNKDLIYIHSFDVEDRYSIDNWYTSNPETRMRWDYESRSKSDFRNRGKSACIANSIEEIFQLPNYVHQLREIKDGEDVSFNDFDKLRIHHFRKPNLPTSTIQYAEDRTLIEKTNKIKEKYR